MSKYDELVSEFMNKHAKADQLVYKNDRDHTPVMAVYLAPNSNVDYDELDRLIQDINKEIE